MSLLKYKILKHKNLKYLLFFISISILLVIFIPIIENQISAQKLISEKQSPGIVENIDWSSAKMQIITGKIMHGKDNKICIVSKWYSRSRISFYVYGIHKNNLTDNINKFVRIKGWVLTDVSRMNPWTRKVLVESILKISNEPKLDN